MFCPANQAGFQVSAPVLYIVFLLLLYLRERLMRRHSIPSVVIGFLLVDFFFGHWEIFRIDGIGFCGGME